MRLPPLNALRAFEAAARHGGFIAAANELHVTRGAISRHVKILEDHLGVPLFLRHAQGVRLTPAGQRLQAGLAEAFALIAREVARARTDAAELRVICPPATSIRWLLPRLDDFRARHPDIRVQLTTDFYGQAGLDPTEYHVGISCVHGGPRPRDIAVLPLFPIYLTPACAPALLERAPPLAAPDDLAAHELLHESPAHTDWTAWIAAFGLSGLDQKAGQTFPNLDIATKAAVMGAGVVMADLVLCRDELAAGTLVAPFPDMVCPSPMGDVCLLGPAATWDEPKVIAFRDWAAEAAAANNPPPPP